MKNISRKFIRECKHKIKKIQTSRFIDAELKSDSDDDSDNDSDDSDDSDDGSDDDSDE